jgi:transposase-like protein
MTKYMRYTQSDKYEIILLVEKSELSITKTLAKLDIHKSTF